MNKNDFKRTAITLLVVAVVITVIYLFFTFLPYIIIAGIVIYIVAKIYRRFFAKKYTNKYEQDISGTEEINDKNNDDDINQAIDVEYKEVDN